MFSRFLILVLLGVSLVISGCETAKGFSKDVKNTWHSVAQADQWVKDNLW